MNRVCDIPLDYRDTPLPSTPGTNSLNHCDTPLPLTPTTNAGFAPGAGERGGGMNLTDYKSDVEDATPPNPSWHVEALQSVGRGLVGPAGEPGADEIDKDWEQWLMFQEALENR